MISSIDGIRATKLNRYVVEVRAPSSGTSWLPAHQNIGIISNGRGSSSTLLLMSPEVLEEFRECVWCAHAEHGGTASPHSSSSGVHPSPTLPPTSVLPSATDQRKQHEDAAGPANIPR